MTGYSILDEVKEMLVRSSRPDYIPEKQRVGLPLEMKALYDECHEMESQLFAYFQQLCEQENWRKAMLVYIHHDSPMLPQPHIDKRTLEFCWDEGQIRDYIAKALSWLEEIGEIQST